MPTKYQDLNLSGVVFTDEKLIRPGSGANRLLHQWWRAADIVIRTAAGGGGTLLVEDTDYTLNEEDAGLTSRASTSVKSTVTIINSSYEEVTLYVSGKYVGDEIEGANVLRTDVRATLESISQDHPADEGEALTSGELWPLDTPDAISSLGREPLEGKSVIALQPWVYENGRPTYANPRCKWNPGGVTESAYNDFRATADPTGQGRGVLAFGEDAENLIVDPEDGTSGSWISDGSGNLAASALLEERFSRSRWTRITGDGTAGTHVKAQYISSTPAVAGGTSRLSDGTRFVTVALRKPPTNGEDTVSVELRDVTAPASRWFVDVTFSTKTVNASTGTLVRREWYGDDVVVVVGRSTSVTGANDHNLRVILGTGSETTALDFTRAMVLDSEFEAPYTPTSRPAPVLRYPIQGANKGTMSCWVRPFFPFDTPNINYVWSWRPQGGTTDFLLLRFDEATDRLTAWLADDSGAGDGETASTATFTANSDFQKPLHTNVIWDTAAASGSRVRLWVDGVEGTLGGSTGAGAGGADLTQRSILDIGQHGGTPSLPWYGWIADLRYQPGVVDTSDAHYNAGVPYYAGNRLLGKNAGFSLDEWGNMTVRGLR